jgi:sensor histidine kinase YesM
MNTKYTKLWMLLLFWALVFLLNTGPHWEIYSSTIELVETVGMITALQIMVVLITLKLLIPQILNKNHKTLFFIALFLLVFLASELNIFIRFNYHEKVYAASYAAFLELFGQMKLSERMFSLWSFKYIFFTKLPLYFFPTAILIAHKFYKNQAAFLRLNEQKRQAELDALKNQLNPHFIFNTLNNLYALSLKKSDLAPMVIEKLSNILDYILYRCNDKFVSLTNEIQLIESYIDLEKIRYVNECQLSLHMMLNTG